MIDCLSLSGLVDNVFLEAGYLEKGTVYKAYSFTCYNINLTKSGILWEITR